MRSRLDDDGDGGGIEVKRAVSPIASMSFVLVLIFWGHTLVSAVVAALVLQLPFLIIRQWRRGVDRD